jgi:hypothetical protein
LALRTVLSGDLGGTKSREAKRTVAAFHFEELAHIASPVERHAKRFLKGARSHERRARIASETLRRFSIWQFISRATLSLGLAFVRPEVLFFRGASSMAAQFGNAR